MNEVLQEFCDSRGVDVCVEREAGILRGVKILGLTSRNGRKYLPAALKEAVGLYEGAKVNVNHPKGSPLAPRDYQDRIGVVRNVRDREGEGLFGDFHFNPKHALAEQMLWDAEHASENVGFSHNVLARTSRRGTETIVEAITKVQSVDLVADPATTRGLYEAETETADSSIAEADELKKDEPGRLGALTLGELRAERPDLVARLLQEQADSLAEARSELESYQAVQAARERSALAQTILREYHLPGPESADPVSQTLLGQEFMDRVLAAPTEADMRRVIEERACLVRSAGEWCERGALGHQRPVSRGQDVGRADVGPEKRLRDFVHAIT